MIKNDEGKYYPYESVGEKIMMVFWTLYLVSGVIGLLIYLF